MGVLVNKKIDGIVEVYNKNIPLAGHGRHWNAPQKESIRLNSTDRNKGVMFTVGKSMNDLREGFFTGPFP